MNRVNHLDEVYLPSDVCRERTSGLSQRGLDQIPLTPTGSENLPFCDTKAVIFPAFRCVCDSAVLFGTQRNWCSHFCHRGNASNTDPLV